MNITVSIQGLDEAIQKLEEYSSDLQRKTRELCNRLAQYGLLLAQASYGGAAYDGDKSIGVTVEETDNGYKIIATGGTVLFVEFGAGMTLGYGHPQADEFGYGPGTYPSDKGHWNDPRGWWIPGTGTHTYGNPPSMTMYNTAQDIRREVESIAREVFGA